eukprot:jgi/Botrbrau1/11769/Bobra.0195s0094.1
MRGRGPLWSPGSKGQEDVVVKQLMGCREIGKFPLMWGKGAHLGLICTCI